MRLKDYLKSQGLTQQEFVSLAEEQNAEFSYFAVQKWCNGQRIPRKDEMATIYRLTDGAVQPNDFYRLTA